MERPLQTTSLGTGSMRRVRYASLAGLMVQQEQQAQTLMAQRMFSITEFASAMGVNPNTCRKWIKSGYVLGVRSGLRGHFRIPSGELARLKGAS